MAETFRPSSGRRKIRQDSSPIVTEITDESCTVRNNFIPYAGKMVLLFTHDNRLKLIISLKLCWFPM